MLLSTRLMTVLQATALGVLFLGCSTKPELVGRVEVPRRSYAKGQNVRVRVEVPKGAVGTHLRIQKKVGNAWKEIATYNPKKNCPVTEEQPGGGYKFITKRSPMCRKVEGSWVVFWQGMTFRQCVKPEPVDPGVYRVCVARFAKKCLVREGMFGFERPRGASQFICSKPFTVK